MLDKRTGTLAQLGNRVNNNNIYNNKNIINLEIHIFAIEYPIDLEIIG
jgi:hypothetical protein